MIAIFFNFFFWLFLLPAFYLFLLTLSAIRIRICPWKNSYQKAAEGHLAVVIPAHNESLCIKETLFSVIGGLDKNASVHVIADNCTDNTAQLSKELLTSAGIPGKVWERNEPLAKSKGQALNWLMSRIEGWGSENGKEVEYILFLDADCTVSRNSIELARKAFAAGALVLQSEYRLAESNRLKGRLTMIGMTAINVVRGLGRGGLNWSDTIKGTGFWIRRNAFNSTFWSSSALAEDLEYSIRLFQKGIKVYFLENSIVIGKQPSSDKSFGIQRTRWESGRFALVRSSFSKIFRALIKKPTMNNMNLALEFMTPPLGLLFFSYIIGMIVFSGYNFLLCTLASVLLILHIVSAVFVGRLPKSVLASLLAVPLFISWKIMLIPSILFQSRNEKWVKTPRD